MRGQVGLVQEPTCCFEYDAVGSAGQSDVLAMTIVGSEILCVADARGVINLWRVQPAYIDKDGGVVFRHGDIGRALGVLPLHYHGYGEGSVAALLAEGDLLITVGREARGRGTAVFACSLREEARQLLAEGDAKHIRRMLGEESDADEEEGEEEEGVGAGLARAVHDASRYLECHLLRLPFEDGPDERAVEEAQQATEQLLFSRLSGLQAALHRGSLYLTPSDPIDARADFTPRISMWQHQPPGEAAPCEAAPTKRFVGAGSSSLRSREFATSLVAHGQRLFSAHPSGIRVWHRASSARTAARLPPAAGPLDGPLELRAVLAASSPSVHTAKRKREGARVMAVTSDGLLCAAYGGKVHVWREHEWCGGGCVSFCLVAMLERMGCVCAMLPHGPRLVTADTDNGWVSVWDVGCCRHESLPNHQCLHKQTQLADTRAPGLISAFQMDGYLSAVNAIALLDAPAPPSDAAEETKSAAIDAPAGRLYAGHDSRWSTTRFSCWW